MAKFLLALLAVIGLSCLAEPALAAGKSVQVLALMSDDAVPEALAVTSELKRAVELDPQLQLVEGEYALEVLLVALACSEPPDANCLQRIAAKIGSANFIWGRLKGDGAELLLELHLWQKDHESGRAELRYAVTPDGTAHTIAAQAALSRLLEKAASAAPTARAARDPAPSDTGGQARSNERSDHDSRRVRRPLAGYVLLASGVALAAGGIYAALRVNGINESSDFGAYRAGLPQSSDACDEAEDGRIVSGAPSPSEIQDDCRTGKTFQVLQYVLFGLGAGALTTGALLVLTHDSTRASGAAAARPRAEVTAHSARVAVDIAF
ncbi:MAG TPA: hypothetical protein VK524_17180 [Polyangiaceae bacterium]|nr:hypothetical protein [Polyangiaceae bacterium]